VNGVISEAIISAHTPGPWEVGDVQRGESPLMVYCDDSLGSRVADLSTSGHGITTAQVRANALLIAAAPDLLAALKRLLATTFPGTEGHDPDCRCVIHEARTAIAKAEGRS
jgi:hypothetical protein